MRLQPNAAFRAIGRFLTPEKPPVRVFSTLTYIFWVVVPWHGRQVKDRFTPIWSER
jgi:hypothetical protein